MCRAVNEKLTYLLVVRVVQEGSRVGVEQSGVDGEDEQLGVQVRDGECHK